MESSCITIKWLNSLDNSFYKINTMTKSEKIREITGKILELKKLGNKVDTKKTIQNLQREMDELTYKDGF